MGLLQSTASQDELLCYESQSEAPAEIEGTKTDYLVEHGGPLNAARGIMLAAVLGGFVWAAILWALL